MSWEISHTPQAWTNVRQRLSFKKWEKILPEALAIDDTAKAEEIEQAYEKAVLHAEDTGEAAPTKPEFVAHAAAHYAKLGHQTCVDLIMERIEEHRTCDNGGFNFYLDRKGWYECSCDDLSPLSQRRLPDWAI